MPQSPERRKTPRLPVHCDVQVTASAKLLRSADAADDEKLKLMILGSILDASVEGFALTLSSVPINEAELVGQRLYLHLPLPGATVEVRAKAVRYDRLVEREQGSSYIVGLRIEEIEDAGREYYLRYLGLLH
jgi:hypothetical protein